MGICTICRKEIGAMTYRDYAFLLVGMFAGATVALTWVYILT